MSAYYHDDIPTIRRKQASLEILAEKHIAKILTHVGETEVMKKRWTGRDKIQTIRHEIKNLCGAARSWAYDDGTTVLGGEASEHAKAMRACLIVEMKIWRAALRKLQSQSVFVDSF